MKFKPGDLLRSRPDVRPDDLITFAYPLILVVDVLKNRFGLTQYQVLLSETNSTAEMGREFVEEWYALVQQTT